jgi:hypothetical protein
MIDTSDIERIVREVLAEMATSSVPAPKSSAPSPTAVKVAEPHRSNTNELVLASRLVTLGEVSGRLAGIRRLLVSPGTVITPAVIDEVKKRNIQVIFNAAASVASAEPLKLTIIAARTKIDTTPLAAALQSEQIEVELLSSKCLIEATDRLAGEAKKPNTLGLLLTPYEAESLCLANKLSGVRAISGRDANQVAADASAVGANVLVINPKKIGPFEIRQMLNEFCRGGIRPCPDVLKQRLT